MQFIVRLLLFAALVPCKAAFATMQSRAQF